MSDVSSSDGGDVTRLLGAWRTGDSMASEALFNLVYPELKGIAGRRLARLGVPVLDPTELVNEAMLRLLGDQVDARNRKDFFGIAATVIRCVLVDIIRRQQADKRGGGAIEVTLSGVSQVSAVGESWLEVEEALRVLEKQDPRKCRVIELSFIMGLNQQQIADDLGVSLTTVERDLRYAKAWLRDHLS
ncbi:sigma-70 family RNA polymerase sigma factor [Lysobacter maris]|uniref:Sigma-70 family RNA polymerase sigma factor n=1 Tax=Marilutibacter maris TaxID=1605891 RepID=A0A508A8S9_9GAMM|nr:ECF-type sigma factor [Lysobacter maris]KAB8174004.1 sigma-70 family RNA polymerase sigma factor [Lysobacter maris]